MSDGEARWPASVAALAALTLQIALLERLTLGTTWIIPAGKGVFLLALTINPERRYHGTGKPIDGPSRPYGPHHAEVSDESMRFEPLSVLASVSQGQGGRAAWVQLWTASPRESTYATRRAPSAG